MAAEQPGIAKIFPQALPEINGIRIQRVKKTILSHVDNAVIQTGTGIFFRIAGQGITANIIGSFIAIYPEKPDSQQIQNLPSFPGRKFVPGTGFQPGIPEIITEKFFCQLKFQFKSRDLIRLAQIQGADCPAGRGPNFAHRIASVPFLFYYSILFCLCISFSRFIFSRYLDR